jgi:hypothetical protein
MLFNLHIFGVFQLSFCYFVPLWSESRHCMLSSLLNLFRCVLWLRRWPGLVLSMCTWKEYIICYWKQWSIDTNYIHWNPTVTELSCVITGHMPGVSVHFWEWIVEVSSCACEFIFSLYFYECCSHMVSESFSRCIRVQNCYMLQNWSLHYYLMILFFVTFQTHAQQIS